MRQRFLRPADLVLICGVLCCAVLLFIHQSTRTAGTSAYVEQNDQLLYQIDLSDPSRRSYTVSGAYELEIVTENGAVWVERATCPDQHCVRTGKLYRTGDTAACIPARVILRISGASAQDAVTG